MPKILSFSTTRLVFGIFSAIAAPVREQPPAAQQVTAATVEAPPTPSPAAAGGEPVQAAAASPPAPARAPAERHEVEPDQETYDRVLQEEIGKGTDRRVAEGRAKAAAVRAARKKAEG